ncbi:MAG: ABC transporter permease, partial [Candidatus Saccharimonadales bacterium]|nr:ABC transporter permease [Candidatus Saccharimonadales bacterium]
MKKILAILGVAVLGLILGLIIYNREDSSELLFEPVSDRVLTISPGLAVERDLIGNISSVNVISTTATLSLDDYYKSLEAKDIEKGAVLALNRGSVDHEGEEVVQNLIGITNADFLEVFGYQLAEGRFFTDDEPENVAVVGQKLANELREKGVESVVGETLRIRRSEYKIIGLLDEISSGSEAADSDWNKLLLVPINQSADVIDGNVYLVEEVRLVAKSS